LQTPAFEYADALGKFLPDEDRPNEGVFAMQDDDDQWMALRYDKALEGVVGSSERGMAGVKELADIDALLTACGYAPDQVAFDTSIVRGLGYYTGPVFEVELLADIRDRKGRPVRIGSIGGGGRYDDLVSRFKGQLVPATGFSFGVSRFLTALERMGHMQAEVTPPVMICNFDKSLMPKYFQLAAAMSPNS